MIWWLEWDEISSISLESAIDWGSPFNWSLGTKQYLLWALELPVWKGGSTDKEGGLSIDFTIPGIAVGLAGRGREGAGAGLWHSKGSDRKLPKLATMRVRFSATKFRILVIGAPQAGQQRSNSSSRKINKFHCI